MLRLFVSQKQLVVLCLILGEPSISFAALSLIFDPRGDSRQVENMPDLSWSFGIKKTDYSTALVYPLFFLLLLKLKLLVVCTSLLIFSIDYWLPAKSVSILFFAIPDSSSKSSQFRACWPFSTIYLYIERIAIQFLLNLWLGVTASKTFGGVDLSSSFSFFEILFIISSKSRGAFLGFGFAIDLRAPGNLSKISCFISFAVF